MYVWQARFFANAVLYLLCRLHTKKIIHVHIQLGGEYDKLTTHNIYIPTHETHIHTYTCIHPPIHPSIHTSHTPPQHTVHTRSSPSPKTPPASPHLQASSPAPPAPLFPSELPAHRSPPTNAVSVCTVNLRTHIHTRIKVGRCQPCTTLVLSPRDNMSVGLWLGEYVHACMHACIHT